MGRSAVLPAREEEALTLSLSGVSVLQGFSDPTEVPPNIAIATP